MKSVLGLTFEKLEKLSLKEMKFFTELSEFFWGQLQKRISVMPSKNH